MIGVINKTVGKNPWNHALRNLRKHMERDMQVNTNGARKDLHDVMTLLPRCMPLTEMNVMLLVRLSLVVWPLKG